MTKPEPSPEYLAACCRWVDEVVTRPPKPFEFLTERRAPEPSAHPDTRMALTLDDVRSPAPKWPGGVKANLPLVVS